MSITNDPYGLSRRRFLKASGMALGAAALAACGGEAGTDTTAGTTATTAGGTATTMAGGSVPQSDLEVVRFDFNTPNQNLQAPYWIGISKGFFSEVGIDLRPENITGLDDPLPPLLAGDIDIELFDAVVLFPAEDAAVLDGAPLGLRWIGCALGYQPIIMIANEGITAENLGGKTVGIARAGTTNEVLAKFALEELGYNWETDVNAVNLTGGSNDWVTAMLSGQVDATLAFSRHVALAEAEGGGAIYTGFRNDPQAGWGMLQSKIDEFPMFPVAWNYAYIKANQWMKDPNNWEEAREIMAGEFGLDYPDNVVAALPIDAGMLTEDLGWNPDEMDALMAFSQELGGYRADLPWRDYVNLEPLFAAQDAHGLPNNPSADLTTGETKAVPPSS